MNLLDLFRPVSRPSNAVFIPEGLTPPKGLPLYVRPLDEYGQWCYRGNMWNPDGTNQYARFYAVSSPGNLMPKPEWHLAPRQKYVNEHHLECIEWVPNVLESSRYVVVTECAEDATPPPETTLVQEWVRTPSTPGWYARWKASGQPVVIGNQPIRAGAIFIEGLYVTSVAPDEAVMMRDYLLKRVQDMEVGRKISADMGRPYTYPYLISSNDLVQMGSDMRKASEADDKRRRKAAKKEENARRAAAGKIR